MDGRVYRDASPFGNASAWPLTIINSIHLYHMVGAFKLTGADYFHHLLFIPALGIPGQVYHWGPLANWVAFFISGLPGGVDYFLLGQQRFPPELRASLPDYDRAAMAAWVIGTILSAIIFVTEVSVSNIPSLDALVVTAPIYLVCRRCWPSRLNRSPSAP